MQPEGLVEVAEECGDALAPADAHRYDAPLGLPTLEFVGQLDGQDGTGGADRMAERDGAAVRVDLLRIDFQLFELWRHAQLAGLSPAHDDDGRAGVVDAR